MRLLLCMSAAVLTVASSAGYLRADIPPLPGEKRTPRPRPGPWEPIPQMAAIPAPNAAHVTVEVSKTATQPRLVVPRPLLERVKSREVRQQVIGGFVTPPVELLLCALALAGGGLCLLRGRARL